MGEETRGAPRRGWLAILGAILFLAAGLPLAFGGGQLIALGGSAYYLVAGVLLVLVAFMHWRRSRAAVWLYAALLLGTIAWALVEAGLNVWALMPRILGPALLGLWFAIPAVRRALDRGPLVPGAALAAPALFALALALLLGSYTSARFQPADNVGPATAAAGDLHQWLAYGGDAGGSRFTPAALITPANAGKLELAWTYRLGDMQPLDGAKAVVNLQLVPLKIGDALYACTPHNAVVAVDADSGKEIWKVRPKIDLKGTVIRVCRGLAYHAGEGDGLCAKRLFMATIDDQLIALDLKTGASCPGFGTNGVVDMKEGLGSNPPGFHSNASPPTIVRSVVVVGGRVSDNQTTESAPGVIRGYDAVTGKLRWAWDVLTPNAVPPLKPGEAYRRGGPNMWSIASADEALGLVYLPTGGSSPDFFGGLRSTDQERYGSSVVALDAETGNVRWSFQTVHHDVWDYDVGSQPVLVDFPMGNGSVPGLIAPTKRGEIFVLDRRTGKPLTKVVERAAPQGAPAGDHLSPTQPYSVDFPSFAPADLTESAMWGATPIDQMWCRIRFRRARYDGQFTPNALQGAIHFAGSFGVIDWGSVAIDKTRGIAIVNASWMPYVDTLIPRKTADAAGLVLFGAPAAKPSGPPVPKYSKFAYSFPQKGTPYAVDSSPFVSPLNFPCNTPPWGALAAIDLKSRKVLWRQPFGTTEDLAPLGIGLPVGIFNLGGAVTTAGGVTFIAATTDGKLRAFETATGQKLWEVTLPAAGQSSPISFVSARTGRQYVVLAAGGHSVLRSRRGDYLVAYALPQTK